MITTTSTVQTPNEPIATSTNTLSPTPSQYPTPTATSIPPLSVDILGCDTSLDITHGMGEVTNAYISITNHSTTSFSNLCVTLVASDEDREHPDKIQCISLLPANTQLILKLTVDTGFRDDTAIQVHVTTNEDINATVFNDSCRQIGLFKLNPRSLGTVVPIATTTEPP